MPRPKKSAGRVGEKQRIGVMLEEIMSRLDLLAEGQAQLDQKMDRQIGQLRAEMNERFSVVEQVIRQNSADIQKNSRDIEAVQRALVELRQKVEVVSEKEICAGLKSIRENVERSVANFTT